MHMHPPRVRGAAARSRRRKRTAGVRRAAAYAAAAAAARGGGRETHQRRGTTCAAGLRTAQTTLAHASDVRTAQATPGGRRRSERRRVSVRARPGGGGGDSRVSVAPSQWPMPCADRKRRGGCVRRALCGADGPQNGGGGGGGMCGWPARGVRCGRVGCVALLCFLGQRELSSTSPLQRLPLPLAPCPARVRRRPARAPPPGSSPPPAISLDSTPLHFHFHPPQPSKNPSFLPSPGYFQITTTRRWYGRPRRFYRHGRPIKEIERPFRSGRRRVSVAWEFGINAFVRAG